MRQQVNTRLPAKTKLRLDSECKSRFPTKDIVIELALENWFTKFDSDQRRKFYSAHTRKPYERAEA